MTDDKTYQPFFWLDKEKFFSLFGQPPTLNPVDYGPEDDDTPRRVPRDQWGRPIDET